MDGGMLWLGGEEEDWLCIDGVGLLHDSRACGSIGGCTVG